MNDELEQKIDDLDNMESMNQTLIVKKPPCYVMEIRNYVISSNGRPIVAIPVAIDMNVTYSILDFS